MADEKTTQKAGYKSTEFWLSLVAALAGFVLASGVGAPAGEDGKPGTARTVAGVVLTALGALGYTNSRTSVKVAAETAKAEESKVAGYIKLAKEKVELYREHRKKAEAERDTESAKAAAALLVPPVDEKPAADAPAAGTGA